MTIRQHIQRLSACLRPERPVAPPPSPPRLRILFLCTGNACRSQMAEGWARHLRADRIEPFSAGTAPAGLDPLAVEVMAECAVDISSHQSKHVLTFWDVPLDYVITLCHHARQVCLVSMLDAPLIHAGFDDPPRLALHAPDTRHALAHYRRVRDEIRNFVATLPQSIAQP